MTLLIVALILTVIHQTYWAYQFFKLASNVYRKDFALTERRVVFKYGTGLVLYSTASVVQLVLVTVLAFQVSVWPRLGLAVIGAGGILSLVRATRLPQLWMRALGVSYIAPLQEVLLDYATDETMNRLQGRPESVLTPSQVYHRMFGPLRTSTALDRSLSGLRASLLLSITHSIAETSPGLDVTEEGISLREDLFDVLGMDPTVYAEQGIDAFIAHATKVMGDKAS